MAYDGPKIRMGTPVVSSTKLLNVSGQINPTLGVVFNNRFEMDSRPSRVLASYTRKEALNNRSRVQFSDYRNNSYTWRIAFEKSGELEGGFDLAKFLKTATFNGFSWTGQPIEIYVANNVTIYSSSTSKPTIIINNPNVNGITRYSNLKITNNGNIIGRGGNGGNGTEITHGGVRTASTAGQSGGTAIRCSVYCDVYNYGTIAGGGGGGGGGSGLHRKHHHGTGGGGGGGGAPLGIGGAGKRDTAYGFCGPYGATAKTDTAGAGGGGGGGRGGAGGAWGKAGNAGITGQGGKWYAVGSGSAGGAGGKFAEGHKNLIFRFSGTLIGGYSD